MWVIVKHGRAASWSCLYEVHYGKMTGKWQTLCTCDTARRYSQSFHVGYIVHECVTSSHLLIFALAAGSRWRSADS